MIICVCNNISEKKIEEILNTKIEKNERIYSIRDLNKEIPICNNCYACFNDVKKIIEKKNNQEIKETEDEHIECHIKSVFDEDDPFE